MTVRSLAVCTAVLIGVATLAALTPAFAGDVVAVAPKAHTLSDSLDDGEEHYVPLDLPEGTLLSFQYRLNRKLNPSSQLTPEAELVAPDGSTVPIPSSFVNSKKGFDVKKLPIESTGRHILILRSASGKGGPYTFKSKAKLPKKTTGVYDGNGAELAIPFACGPGAAVSAKVSGPKGGAVPELPRVRQPNGNAFGPLKLKQKKNGFTFKKFEQSGGFGIYAVTFGVTPESAQGDRSFKYKISVKWPKATKRSLRYSDIVVAPIVISVAPDDVAVGPGQTDLVVQGRFFQPGAQVVLEMAGESDWNPANQIATDTSITLPIETLAQAPGRWDVVVANPSGGQTELKRALLVRPATPTLVSITPPTTTDDRSSEAVTLTGNQLSTTTSVTFRRALPGGGEETFLPESVSNAPGGGIIANISPFRRPLGAYDVILQNPGPTEDVPGSSSTTVQDAFEILNAPPRVDSATPDRNLAGGTFTMTIRGAELESGAQAFLDRDGEDSVEATQEAVSFDGAAMTARFDMDGQAKGGWNLRIVNPDDQETGLDDAFAVTADAVLDLGNSVIGEPSVDLAIEHDMGLVAWIESNETGSGGSSWLVRARRFDLLRNDWIGDPVDLGVTFTNDESKRFVWASYNPDVDQWLVVWTEHTFASTINEKVRAGVTPTSGVVYQVYGRRFGTDGVPVGNVIDFIDGSASATGGGQIYEDFEYSNPQLVWAPWDGNWYMTFTQRWDNLTVNTSPTTYVNDDYDVFVWRLAKADPQLDTSFHFVVHKTQNHEGDCLAAVDPDREKLFIVGSCDSRQLTAVNPREIEAKWMTNSGTLEFGADGSNAGHVLAISSRSSETLNYTNPRPAYNPDADEFLVVWEKPDETDTDKKEIWAQRVSAGQQTTVGQAVIVAQDSDHDLILPRVIYNEALEEYLVTWTVDDVGGSPQARAQRLDGSDASIVGSAFDIGASGSGLPDVRVDTARGCYVAVTLDDFDGFTGTRVGGGIRVELFE